MDRAVMILRSIKTYEVMDSDGYTHKVEGSLQILDDFVIIGGMHLFFRPRYVRKV
jgi:hypothetical protein